jgi:hypothetical protein
MIGQMHQDTIDIRRSCANCAFQRGQLSALEIGVVHDSESAALGNFVPDRLLVRASHHDHLARDFQHGAQGSREESVVSDTQKRLGKSHAARLAGRQKNPVDGGPSHDGSFFKPMV